MAELQKIIENRLKSDDESNSGRKHMKLQYFNKMQTIMCTLESYEPFQLSK